MSNSISYQTVQDIDMALDMYIGKWGQPSTSCIDMAKAIFGNSFNSVCLAFSDSSINTYVNTCCSMEGQIIKFLGYKGVGVLYE